MAGLAGFALGTAPVAGGALLAVAAGQFKSPDFRALIKQDQDLLERIPAEQSARRAELQRTIDVRIDDLITATHRSRELREAASRYTGNWRDVVLFLCVVLFAVIWWNVPHSRTNWLPTFIVLILLAMVTAAYAMRGLIRSLGNTRHRQRHRPSR
jgi:anti-sigma-K factor RskA